jgi:hypothetical protein
VAEEREKARQVFSVLQRQYGDLVELVPVMWEDLAIPATASLQEGIDRLLEDRLPVDIAVFILWSRLGNPLGNAVMKRDGSPYLSGTEREFDMMLAAHERSGGKRPVILAYTREDDEAFSRHLDIRTHGEERLEEMLRQRRMVKHFIQEKFLDEHGRSLRAYHIYRDPVGFAQRLHSHLRGILFEFLSEREPLAVWTEAPYRGLEAFDIRHAPVFFGRDEEVCQILQRLRERESGGASFVCIVGASGSGKSSLARAGVAATLVQRSFDDGVADCRAAVITPSGTSEDLSAGLAAALGEAAPALKEGLGGLARLARCLEQGNTEAASILWESALAAEERQIGGPLRVLLVLDQMDELWTEGWIAPEPRERFLKAIEWLAFDPRAAVLATLRSDFYSQAQASDVFLRLKGERGHFDLAPPGPAALQQLITLPAQRAGLRFERDLETGRTLDQTILEDAAKDSAALPLLQYALLELHARRDQKTGILTFQSYRDMGGVEGALARRAAELFDSLPASAHEALGQILPLLVSIEGGTERQAAVRRSAPLADLTSTPARKQLVEELVRARFLIAGDGVGRLSHEALLRNWDRIREWVEQNRALLRLRSRIEKHHAIWEESGRDEGTLLVSSHALEEASSLLQTRPDLLDQGCREYVEASIARRRKRLFRAVALAALVLAMLGSGLFSWWNHVRTREERFARLTEVLGVPAGVGKLDFSKSSQTGAHYLVESSRDRVRHVTFFNGSGQPMPDADAPLQAASRELVYREDGSLQAVIFKNAGGRVLAQHRYGEMHPVPDGGLMCHLEIKGPHGGPHGMAGDANALFAADPDQKNSARSEVTAYRLEFDKNGHITRRLHLNNYLSPHADAGGSFGLAYLRNADGLETSRITLGESGEPRPGKNGVESTILRLGPSGHVLETAYLGAGGLPIIGPEGWHRRVVSRDENGNRISEEFFGPNGARVFSKNGYAKLVAKFDYQGNEIETEFLGADWKPVSNTNGVAKVVSKFNSDGRQTEARFFGADGLPVADKSGCAGWTAVFDDAGNQVAGAYFGIDGQPVFGAGGYAKWTAKFDAAGQQVERAFFDADGEPVLHMNGYARWVSKFDQRGYQTERAYFGTKGEPVLDKNGCAKWTRRIDECGNEIERAFFGLNSEPVSTKEGYAKWAIKFDGRGNQIEREFFGVDGKPVANRKGFAKWTSKFDNQGHEIEAALFGVDGKPVIIGAGYAKWTAKFDVLGNEIEGACFGVEGEPVLGADGYAIRRAKYDPRGNPIERTYLGTDGNPVKIKQGYAKAVSKYNERGEETELAFFGPDGRPVLSDVGIAIVRGKFDELGMQRETSYFGTSGEPINSVDGYARWTSTYDARGNPTEFAYFAADGKPVRGHNGAAIIRMEHDSRGNEVSISYLGEDGRPLLNLEGVARWAMEFDERGNEISIAGFGVDEKPAFNILRSHLVRQKFNPHGMVVEKSYFGVRGEPLLNSLGFHREVLDYDTHARLIRQSWLDLRGDPAINTSIGAAAQEYIRDIYGNLVDSRFFGVDGRVLSSPPKTTENNSPDFETTIREIRRKHADHNGDDL